jgi:protein SCO1
VGVQPEPCSNVSAEILQARAYQIKAGHAMNSLRTGFAAVCLLLAACGGQRSAPPLEGATIGGPFTLTDQNGKRVSDRDFDGRYRLVYFGYAYCPDVCPTDLAKLGVALRGLEKSDPALAARIAPIFITVDPERDTPQVIKRFVENFHPRLIGLTGTRAEIDQAAGVFRVWHQKQKPGAGGGYLVDHTAITYLMGPKGEPLAALSQDMTPEQMVAEIRKWAK